MCSILISFSFRFGSVMWRRRREWQCLQRWVEYVLSHDVCVFSKAGMERVRCSACTGREYHYSLFVSSYCPLLEIGRLSCVFSLLICAPLVVFSFSLSNEPRTSDISYFGGCISRIGC